MKKIFFFILIASFALDAYIYKLVHLKNGSKNVVIFFDIHNLGSEEENQIQFQRYKLLVEEFSDNSSIQILVEGPYWFDYGLENTATIYEDENKCQFCQTKQLIFFEQDTALEPYKIGVKYEYEGCAEESWIFSFPYLNFISSLPKNITVHKCDPRFDYYSLDEMQDEVKERYGISHVINPALSAYLGQHRLLNFFYDNYQFSEKDEDLRNQLESIISQIGEHLNEITSSMRESFDKNGLDGLKSMIDQNSRLAYFQYFFDFNLILLSARESAPKWTFIPVGGEHGERVLRILGKLGFTKKAIFASKTPKNTRNIDEYFDDIQLGFDYLFENGHSNSNSNSN